MQNCLDQAMKTIPQCDQVTELNEFAEVTTLNKTLIVIIDLTFRHDESKVGITAIGGVDAVVKVMKTFPKCQTLQEHACLALATLAHASSTGKQNIIESGGIEILLAAVTNHLDCARVCVHSCWTLANIVRKSKEDTELLIGLGGGAAVAKVRRKWPDNNDLQKKVQCLAKVLAAEMNSWGDEE
jgi:hypothetical protein